MAPVYDWDEHNKGNKGVYKDNGKEVSWQDVQDYYGIGNSSDENNDFAIVISFPDAEADIPQDGSVYEKVGKWVDSDNNGKLSVGHAGVIIIDGETGWSYYFDYGRYTIPGLGKRPKNKGAVRSGKSFPGKAKSTRGLQVPNAIIEDGEIKNMAEILKWTHNKSLLGGNYGRMLAALYTNLNFESMFKYANDKESLGYTKFQCPSADYCAKFVREVVAAGGGWFTFGTFTGEQNVFSTTDPFHSNPSKIYQYGKKK